jgi:thiol-disulfide isomerase/thioredoxin
MPAVLPAFSLRDSRGQDRSFPSGRRTLVAFVKEDCPTCDLVTPVLDALARAADLEVLIVGQDAAGNAKLIERHGLALPILDDSTLKVSFAWDVDTVPTLFLADREGRESRRLIGFVRDEWRAFFSELGSAPVDWPKLPEWRPGCGSKSADPTIADRLRAESENSPLRARRIEIAPADDEFEFMFDQGFTDGLPVVPPTPERVIRMLSGTRRDPQEVVAIVAPNMAEATVEKVAINAVLAGCRPDYLPVVIAALEAVCNDSFNAHGVMATTMGASPLLVVNGPIRHRLGMGMGIGALGQGNRANACIGRALRLVLRNVGGARPGGTERSTLGNTLKFTGCFAEWEERSNWPPLHVERGFAATESVVTAFPVTSGPQLIVDQKSRTAAQLAGSLGLVMQDIHHPRSLTMDCVLVVSPEHVDTLATGNYTKADLRAKIQSVTAVPLRERVADAVTGEGFDPARAATMSAEALERRVPKFVSDAMIHIVVAGAEAGKFSGLFHGWVGGEIGSVPVSRKIEEVR